MKGAFATFLGAGLVLAPFGGLSEEVDFVPQSFSVSVLRVRSCQDVCVSVCVRGAYRS